MNVFDKERAGLYKNNLPYSGKKGDVEVRRAHGVEEARIVAEFRSDLEMEFGMAGHVKADALFSRAWEDGHAYGLSEVASRYADLVELAR